MTPYTQMSFLYAACMKLKINPPQPEDPLFPVLWEIFSKTDERISELEKKVNALWWQGT